ncbi:thermonuclease family protein [Mesorhizobium amorphae]|uniref:thermonuclease family protein n=1 Tax=Mesorhizobium amorphae TaxID=71433 RepID=UPI001781082B|nr:thermonuclease family protein [Mesorhizobium amorphae]
MKSDRQSHRRRTRPRRGRQSSFGRVSGSGAIAIISLAIAGLAASAYAAFSLTGGSHNELGKVITNWTAANPPAIMGTASVVDGDTIEVHGQRIRFNGIDAPESRQLCKGANGVDYPCGRRSAEALDTFLAASRPVQCTFVTWDRYHRFVGDCRRADGASVASWMVEHGQALDWPRYSNGAYARQQAQAKAAKVGLWTGEFEAPWDWRSGHSDDPKPSTNHKLGLITHGQIAQSYSCQPRRYCSQISSCEEAHWYLNNCSWGSKLDRDGDGIPCEGLC